MHYQFHSTVKAKIPKESRTILQNVCASLQNLDFLSGIFCVHYDEKMVGSSFKLARHHPSCLGPQWFGQQLKEGGFNVFEENHLEILLVVLQCSYDPNQQKGQEI